MVDIRELKSGDIFYYVHQYYFYYKLEVVEKICTDGKLNILVRHFNHEIDPGSLDIVGQDECEEFFFTEEEATYHYNNFRQKELERLENISTLLDELYNCASNNGLTEKEKILLEAINNFKEKNILIYSY